MKIKRVFVLVNPTNPQSPSLLPELYRKFNESGIEWDIGLTQAEGSDHVLDRAVDFGADLVAVYGGDGTIASVVGGLINRKLPLAILPGGTANVLATELRIPRNFSRASSLICHRPHHFKEIDVGEVNGKYFTLRVGIGIEANAVDLTHRKMKKGFGPLAYALSAMNAIVGTRRMEFHLKLDGKMVHTKGLSCIIANSGNLGVTKVGFSPTDLSDGKLDVFVVRSAHLNSLFAVVTHVVTKVNLSAIQHWRAADIEMETTPRQKIHYDGEILGDDKIKAHLHHKALKVLVPA